MYFKKDVPECLWKRERVVMSFMSALGVTAVLMITFRLYGTTEVVIIGVLDLFFLFEAWRSLATLGWERSEAYALLIRESELGASALAKMGRPELRGRAVQILRRLAAEVKAVEVSHPGEFNSHPDWLAAKKKFADAFEAMKKLSLVDESKGYGPFFK